jgi:hypothetical protein
MEKSALIYSKPLFKRLSQRYQKGRVSIYIFDGSEGKYLTAEFTERPLESGIRSILKGLNYAIVYQEKHRPGNVQWIKNTDKRVLSGTNTVNTVLEVPRLNRNNPTDTNTSSHAVPETGRILPGMPGTNSNGVVTQDNQALNNHFLSMSTGNSIVWEGDVKYQGEDILEEQQGALENINNNDNSDEGNIITVEEETSKNGLPSWYKGNMSKEEARLRYRIEKLEKDIESGYADNHYDRWVAIKGTKIIRLPDENLADYKNRLQQLLGN